MEREDTNGSSARHSTVQYIVLAVLWAAEQMLKYRLLLKATKHVDVAARAAVCYLFLFYLAIRQWIILHKMINMNKWLTFAS